MNTAPLSLLLFLATALLLGGCSSIEADAARGAGLTAKTQRFFVVSNPNDNRALDQRIVTALQARGLTAAAGPRTMMPDDTQVILTYSDHWSWDFGEHIDYLRLAVHGLDSNDILAAATYSSRIPGKQTVPETVNRVVARLFDRKGGPVLPADKLPPAPETGATGRKRGR